MERLKIELMVAMCIPQVVNHIATKRKKGVDFEHDIIYNQMRQVTYSFARWIWNRTESLCIPQVHAVYSIVVRSKACETQTMGAQR